MPHAGDRPSKFRKTVKTFLRHVRAGLTLPAAAARAGIDESTGWRWLQRGREATRGEFREFCKSYQQACGVAEALLTERIVQAGFDDPRHWMWILERRFPERWSLKQQHELSGPHPQTIVNVTQTAAAVSRLTKAQQADLDRLYEGIQRRTLTRAMHELDGKYREPGDDAAAPLR